MQFSQPVAIKICEVKMENQIEDLLNEISKFRTNIANSIELMELLEIITQDIDSYKDMLNEEHEQLIGKIQKYTENINNSISSINSAIKENHVVVSKIELLLHQSRINKLFWITLGLIISTIFNSVLLIIILINF